jgi:hypothetical protein
MAKRKYVTNLFDYLNSKIQVIQEEIGVDVVPVIDKNITDGVNVIIALGNIQIKHVIKPEFINEALTLSIRKASKNFDYTVVDGTKATEFLNDVKQALLSNETTKTQIKELIKDPKVDLSEEELFSVTDISGKIGMILIDKSVELEITKKGEMDGKKMYMLKLTKDRITLSQQMYEKIKKANQ